MLCTLTCYTDVLSLHTSSKQHCTAPGSMLEHVLSYSFLPCLWLFKVIRE
jgi:hypothetical protein